MYFMGVDMGTSGCKAVIFDEEWQIVCQSCQEYSLHLPGSNLLELDPELVWKCVQQTIQEANRKCKEPVAALAVSAIGDVIVPVDEMGNAVRFAIVDFDPRGEEEIKAFAEQFGKEELYRINGMPPLYIGSLAKILWIQQHEPEVFQKVRRWATFEDFIVNKMGLPPVASYSEVSRTMLFDIRDKTWSQEIISEIPLTTEVLPYAVESGTVIGTLSEQMWRELGFLEPVKIVAGGHDMVCAAVGAGLNEKEPGTAIDIAGTIEGLVVSLPEINTSKTMLEHKFPCYVGHKGYVTFSVNLTAGCIVRWFRDEIAPEEYLYCKKKQINFYEYIQRKIDLNVPGTILLLPHFSGSGNPYFDAGAQGAIYGLTMDTKREDIARAMIESLSYELNLHLEAYKCAGIQIDTLRAAGGGAAIDRQLQLKANITGMKVVKSSVTEASAMGAAAYAAYGVKALDNPASAYRSIHSKEKVFFPDQAVHKKFQEKFKLYQNFSESIHRLEQR